MATKIRKGMFLADEARKKRDEGWLGRLLAGDHEAFAEFVDKYKEMVFLCCRTLGLRVVNSESCIVRVVNSESCIVKRCSHR
jgi:hypothetical protein